MPIAGKNVILIIGLHLKIMTKFDTIMSYVCDCDLDRLVVHVSSGIVHASVGACTQFNAHVCVRFLVPVNKPEKWKNLGFCILLKMILRGCQLKKRHLFCII